MHNSSKIGGKTMVKSEKKRISINVNEKVIEELRERNFNISSLCDSLLSKKLKVYKQFEKELLLK